MEWTLGLSTTLEVLFLEGFFGAIDIRPVGQLANLETLGLEGGMDTKLRLESLAPLSSLGNLRYLFLASTRVADKSLSPLGSLTSLRHLTCGAYFPDDEFIALGKSLRAGMRLDQDDPAARQREDRPGFPCEAKAQLTFASRLYQ